MVGLDLVLDLVDVSFVVVENKIFSCELLVFKECIIVVIIEDKVNEIIFRIIFYEDFLLGVVFI